MTAEVNNVMAQLATIEAEITDPVSGLAVRSYENVPYTISAADMPLFVNYVGELNNNALTGSDERGREFNETRAYYLNLYHSPYGSGIEGEKMGLLTPYFSMVYTLFGKYPHLKQLPGALDAKIVGDSGMKVLTFAGQQYYGIRFTLQVISKVRRPLGEDE